MKLGKDPKSDFKSGFEAIRGTEYASKEVIPHQGETWYWVPQTSYR